MMSAVFSSLALLLLAVSVLPLNRLPIGFIRVFDFPRLQILSLTVVTLTALLIFETDTRVIAIASIALLATMALQCAKILPFVPISQVSSPTLDEGQPMKGKVRLLSLNVKQSNNSYDQVSALIRKMKPDLVVLMEVNDRWVSGLEDLIGRFEHSVLQPQDNTYGMALLSGLPLENPTIRHFLSDEVPSIEARVELGADAHFRLFCLHPEPPVPYRDTRGRDAEILACAKEIAHEKEPVIVMGDLNDVAWSETTNRFLDISGLLDPRRGRGFFNTFDARLPFFRWPLDHVFHSRQFRFVDMRRLNYVGSDHFPILCELALVDSERVPERETNGSDEEHKEAEQLIEAEKASNRKPIGTDWEE